MHDSLSSVTLPLNGVMKPERNVRLGLGQKGSRGANADSLKRPSAAMIGGRLLLERLLRTDCDS